MRRLTVLATLLAATALAPVTSLPAEAATAATAAPAATCHRTLASYPVLRPGDRRPAVRTLQCVLNDGGWGPVVVDGFYGPQTRQAVRRVEAGFEGPSPSPGRINNGFWVLLFGQQLPDRNLQLGQHGPAVRTLQRALRAAGGRSSWTRSSARRHAGGEGLPAPPPLRGDRRGQRQHPLHPRNGWSAGQQN